MKTVKGTLALILFALATTIALGQSNTLQFTATRATDEGAIHLEWASQSNHVYQIQCTDTLIDTNTGTTPWQVLYDNYPSHGTNTFWLDTGNYFKSPAIVHPRKSPMRFYRVVDKGPDDLVGDEPTVSIVSPTNGTVISGLLTVSVAASTDQGSVDHKLYVDGQEMWLSPDGTNYTINTCEWGNGPHVLFATATSSTQPDGPAGAIGFTGHGVSGFIPIYFSNLVTRISFSEQFFQPSLGQTQQVSAVFAANSDWTLEIKDVSSNTVRTTTGNGTSMSFAWDGTDDNSADLPNGVYYYYISAETNSAPSGSFASQSMMTSASMADDSTQLWVMPHDGSDNIMPFAIYPPGMDTNGLEIFEASASDVQEALSLNSVSVESMDTGSSFSANAGAAPSAQNGPPAPLRPPNPPCRGSLGTIALGWQMYNANGTNPVYCAVISDGSGITGHNVQIENNPGGTSLPFAPFRRADLAAINFATEMQKGCWNIGPLKHDDELQISDLQGSGSYLNNADIALLVLHGVYGTSFDFTTGHQFKGIYFPIASGGSAHYVRMSDMSFGGSSPTNGLKWLGLVACTGLYQQNWNSMKSQGVKPYNSNMHMICGATTDLADEPLIGQFWADLMLGDPTVGRKPMAVRDAWYAAGTQAYTIGITNGVSSFYPNPTTYAVAADANCSEDTLQTNSVPTGSGTWSYYNTKTVFPPP
jgi:Family of unknown function (DUF6345)/FlgD Ig-like domain/Bacterial Ig domain